MPRPDFARCGGRNPVQCGLGPQRACHGGEATKPWLGKVWDKHRQRCGQRTGPEGRKREKKLQKKTKKGLPTHPKQRYPVPTVPPCPADGEGPKVGAGRQQLLVCASCRARGCASPTAGDVPQTQPGAARHGHHPRTARPVPRGHRIVPAPQPAPAPER